ncbi:NF-kappa-B essential modulator-like [Anopheles aquasalis]|uniref:NF-kappa-B essential modulator-like n=1 Tax=Anopheles aquasalis TaxID=42839 RepID=UPI00215ABAB2|nr:NF-kappa-B essential modulator-like [Anopheles aquasalis]
MSLSVQATPATQPPSMEEESFIILGSSPTPSMETISLAAGPPSVASQQVASPPSSLKRSALVSKMETSTQLDSTTYSLLTTNGGDQQQQQQAVKSLLSDSSNSMGVASMIDVSVQSQPNSLRSIENKENCAPQNGGARAFELGPSPTVSFVMGETRSLLLQQFPSLAQASMSAEEMRLLQKLSSEHGQLKESLQRANVAMRKNFASIQQLQDETKTRRCQLESRIDEQQQQIEQQETEIGRLKEALVAAETVAAEREKEKEAIRAELQAELEEIRRVREMEQKEAQQEVDELRKVASERQAIIQNLASKIENLELQIKGFVVVKTNQPEPGDGNAKFVPIETHQQQVKALERRMSVEVAKNLEFEDMRKLYVDEINCLKANVQAAEKVYTASRVDMQKLYDELKERDTTIEKLHADVRAATDQIIVLGAQSEIYQKDFEAERTAREELASEKSRILAEFEVLQRQNAELTAQRNAQEQAQTAETAARMVQLATEAANPAPRAEPSPPTERETEPLSLLRCPLCLKGFRDFGTLQNHASDCMGAE